MKQFNCPICGYKCVKNAIGDGNVKNLVDEIKQAEVLILDDIGAEQSTPWVRDEVLQVILQYRLKTEETEQAYNFVPADSAKTVKLAILTKYMWFDAYLTFKSLF